MLQTWEWGEFKRVTTGWQPLRLAFLQGGELVAMASVGLRRQGPLRILYAPRGPTLAWEDAQLRAAVLDQLQALAQRVECPVAQDRPRPALRDRFAWQR